ncbi:hypothetical protein NECAME_15427 [Necator americanus]|uniref:Uncharacterized protein n=1 Tax=Necator americanus TaxID=51031 RepID=W2SI09_NECAM|nr:hypothetical protein NECAME_15427 [Necator americanus]ETN69264.1 hypothetical protein NECAME_15427 [Necator americanus]
MEISVELQEKAICFVQKSKLVRVHVEKIRAFRCHDDQKVLDACVEEKLHLTRPKMGYFSKLHVHESVHPPPEVKMRDYKAEAAKVLAELPDDYHLRKDYRKYNDWRYNIVES